VFVENVATPVIAWVEPNAVVPSRNVTVPEGVKPPPANVAVKVTAAPTLTVLADALRLTVGVPWLTMRLRRTGEIASP
jgi:hypothetical protein